MTNGISFDKASYTKGDTITITVTDSGRQGAAEISENVTVTGVLANGQSVTATAAVTTPAVPDKTPGVITDNAGRLYAVVPASVTSTVAKYTTIA